jgi:polar amino acid transport system substrate-binding protein
MQPNRRHVMQTLGAAALLGQAACASGPSGAALPAGSAAALAPTGKLRACINLGNPILARRDATSGAVSGVSVDLATDLAKQLGLPLELIVVDAALKSVQTVTGGGADVGFFAVDPGRAAGVRFTAPYVLIEGAYLVKNASPIKDNAEVDRAGTRVMVGKGSAYDLFLSRNLRAAKLAYAPTSPTVVERFLAEGVEVAAGVKQQLQADAARLGGLRLLPGRFMVIEQAMGLPANRGDAAAAALKQFVEQAKASGFVATALKRHNIEGASVAPASAG